MITAERMIQICSALPQRWLSKESFHNFGEIDSSSDVDYSADQMLKVSHQPFDFTSTTEMTSLLNLAWIFNGQHGRVLEFGCGIGRLFRRLPVNLRAEAVGVDIDADSIAQSQAKIKPGTFRVIDAIKPLQFKDGHFAWSYAFSVFTHMSSDHEQFWLRELTRVTSGPVIISVHGLPFLAQCETWKNCLEGFARIIEAGFHCVDGVNDHLLKHVDSRIYKDTSHTPDNIVDSWGKVVDVQAVIPGGFGGTHDAVVVRRKK